ncbi:hypothetical protein V6Z12_D07G205200 [Gossypium hirsutum]
MASSSNSLGLKLSLKPTYVPKTITDLMKDLPNIENETDKLAVLSVYISQHEEELNSIAALRGQLPQCMLLLMEALGTLRQEFLKIKNGMVAGKEGDNIDMVLKENSGMKRKRCEKMLEAEQVPNLKCDFKGKGVMMNSPPPHHPSNHKHPKAFRDFVQAPNQNPNSNGGGGLNLRADNRTLLNYKHKPLTQPIWKNNRRSWSPQLHARFVETLHILGGMYEATPKQIREMMNVDGLTNDQVKSHLQKYRLHSRKQQEGCAQQVAKGEDPWDPDRDGGEPMAPAN